jgi:hypothetical protein
MKRLLICAVLLGACMQEAPETKSGPPPELAPVSLPVADQAGNRMEALMQTETRSCTADGVWCVETDESGARAINGAATIALPTEGGVEAWPNIIRQADGAVLVGLVRRQSQMFSGGGAEVRELALYSIANGTAHEAGTLPLGGEISIRACFSEEDTRARRDACLDQYDFATRISLNEAVTSGPAQIVLETRATTYPGRLDRNVDSTEAPPLQEADLVEVADEACSYRRTLTRGADGRYTPDQPLPPCTQFLEP